MAYRVTAPFIMLKVKDAVTGAFTFQGLYEGAIADDVEPENLKHHLDLGMVEEVAAEVVSTPQGDAAAAADVAPPRAGKGSGRDEWAAYAAAVGVVVDDDMSRDDIIDAVDSSY
jgi:hypothetical protein